MKKKVFFISVIFSQFLFQSISVKETKCVSTDFTFLINIPDTGIPGGAPESSTRKEVWLETEPLKSSFYPDLNLEP